MSLHRKNFRIIWGIAFLALIFAVALGWRLGGNFAANRHASQSTKLDIPTTSPTPLPTEKPKVVLEETPSPTIALTPSQSLSPTLTVTPLKRNTNTQVKVFFSHNPKGYDDPSYAVWKGRLTARADTMEFVIDELIKGPTAAEKSAGLFSPLRLTGESNCDNQDYVLVLDETTNIATVKLCKMATLSGGDARRVHDLLYYSLEQFGTVKRVIVLDRDDNCLGDLSGLNQCKK